MQLSANGTWLSIAAPYNNGQMAILEEQRTIYFFATNQISKGKQLSSRAA